MRPPILIALECDRKLIYDVGLHRGEDAAYYLALGFDVVGFEADPELSKHCRQRFASELADGRFTLVEGAIAPRDAASVTFFQHPNSVFGTTDAAWAERNRPSGAPHGIEVGAVDFATCLRTFGAPFLLKIDIEGADRLCLAALHDVDARPCYVSLESDKVDFASLVAEFDTLCALGYDRYAVVQQAGITRIENAMRADGSRMAYTFEPGTSGPFGPDVGPWMSRDEALARYRRIFRAYRLFGDHSWMRRSRIRVSILLRIQTLLRTPLPGWYDTHAARSADLTAAV